jgi:hypothetical protein
MYGEVMRIGMLVAMGSLVLTGAFAAPYDPEMLFRDPKVEGEALPELDPFVKPSESADWELSYSAVGTAVYKTLEGKLAEFPISIPRRKEPIRLTVSAFGTMLDVRGHITVHGNWRASRYQSDHAILKVYSQTSTRGMTRTVEGGSDLHHRWLSSGTELITAGSRNTQVDSEFKTEFSLPVRFHYRSTLDQKDQDDLLIIEHHLYAKPGDDLLKIQLEPNRFTTRVLDSEGRSSVGQLESRISTAPEVILSKRKPSDQSYEGTISFNVKNRANEPVFGVSSYSNEDIKVKKSNRGPGEFILSYSLHSSILESEMKANGGEAVRFIALSGYAGNSPSESLISIRFKKPITTIVSSEEKAVFARGADMEHWDRVSAIYGFPPGGDWGLKKEDNLQMAVLSVAEGSILDTFPARNGEVIWQGGEMKSASSQAVQWPELKFSNPFDRYVSLCFYSTAFCNEKEGVKLRYGPNGFEGSAKVYYRRVNSPDPSKLGLDDVIVMPVYSIERQDKSLRPEKKIVGPLPYWTPKSDTILSMRRVSDLP